jgi:hypothetical protein
MIDPRPLALALTAPVYGVPAIVQGRAAEQATQQQQAARQQLLDLFRNGFAACLEPKGCTVK